LASAQPKSSPSPTCCTPVFRLATWVGMWASVKVPMPSWPTLLLPQHWRSPMPVMAQLSALPAAIAVAASSGVGTGTSLAVVVPLPSSPLPLSPQHHTRPVFSSAQAWK